MRATENYELNLLDAEDFVNREVLNENTEKIDEVLNNLENPTHDTATQANVEELTSGESLKVALRKLAKAVADYISHKADKVAHITAEERTAWNAKLGVEKIAANLTTDTDGMVLAAAMGKNLKEQIDTNANAISTLNSNMNNTCSLAAGESITISFRNAYGTGNIAILQIYHPIERYRALYFVISGGGSGIIDDQKAQIIPLLESSVFSIEHNSNHYNALKITNNYTSSVTVRVVLLSGIFSNFTIS